MRFHFRVPILSIISITVAAACCVASAPAQHPAAAGALVRHPQPALPIEDEVISNPTRPNWDASATTTLPHMMEVDTGWLAQPMGSKIYQEMLQSSLRYGVTEKFDLRWGTSHVSQNDDDPDALQGWGDQWFSARYRFMNQEWKLPSLAFIYSIKVPTANCSKGFGSGLYDHQFVFVASRDLGKNHIDFNVVGTVIGEEGGHDGSAQFGLAVTRPVFKKLSAILESYGGPQPGTSDRFGAGFIGVAYTVRPSMVLDVAYDRTYTAGSPRAQFMFGTTYALRPVARSLHRW